MRGEGGVGERGLGGGGSATDPLSPGRGCCCRSTLLAFPSAGPCPLCETTTSRQHRVDHRTGRSRFEI